MKKTIFLMIALFGLGFTSCKKCVTCTNCNYSGDNGEYCKLRFETQVSFNQRINNLESNGCSCD